VGYHGSFFSSVQELRHYSAEIRRYRAELRRYSAKSLRYSAEVRRYSAKSWRYSAEVRGYSAKSWRYSAKSLCYSAEVRCYSAELWRYSAKLWRYSTKLIIIPFIIILYVCSRKNFLKAKCGDFDAVFQMLKQFPDLINEQAETCGGQRRWPILHHAIEAGI